jgi:acyl dehydratase
MLDRTQAGRRSEAFENEVEKGAVRRFAEALGLGDPIHFDEKQAQAAGYRNIVAPVSFVTSFRSSLDLRQALRIENRVLLCAEQSIDSFRPICVGDRIAVVAMVVEITQRGGADGVVVEDEGRDEQGHLVYRARRTWIVRPTAREA